MAEVFKKIRGFPDYRVSSLGRVWSAKTGRFLKVGWHRDGYYVVTLTKDGVQTSRILHALVCTAFHGKKPSAEHQVRHLDGKAANCRADNLAWGTPAENGADKSKHGFNLKNLSEKEVLKFAKAYKAYLKGDSSTRGYQRTFIENWCLKLGASYSALYDITRGRTWSQITGITEKSKVSLKGIPTEYNKGDKHWTQN